MTAGLTYAAYLAVVTVAIALQVAALRGLRVAALRGRVPTLGRLIGTLVGRRSIRLVLLLGWAWTGWHLFARGSAGFVH